MVFLKGCNSWISMASNTWVAFVLIIIILLWNETHAVEDTVNQSGTTFRNSQQEKSCDAKGNECLSHHDSRTKHILFVSIAIRSHALPLLRIADEMNRRGYQVSFATHDSGKEWAQAMGLPFISAGSFPVSADELRSKLKLLAHETSNLRGVLTMFSDIYVASAPSMYENLVQNFETQPPDIVVFDIASIAAQMFAEKLDIPYIVNSPSIMFDLEGMPSYVPTWGTGFNANMSLWNRCMNILFPRLLSVALTPPFMQLNKMRWDLGLPPFQSQHDIHRGARILLNTALGLEYAQPFSPMVEVVGPILPTSTSIEKNDINFSLSPTLMNWLNDEKSDGVIFVDLGSMTYIDKWQAEAVIEGLTAHDDEPQLKVLWMLPVEQWSILPSDIPSSFQIKPSGSIRKFDILSHARVRLVVSNCGMLAVQESLVSYKPVLCIPFLEDQPDIAARVVDAGAGLSIDKSNLNAGELHAKTIALYSNTSFVKCAKRVGRLLESAGGLSRAIQVIESTLKIGFQHLETVDFIMPWYKSEMFDIWAVHVALFLLFVVFLRVHWIFLCFMVSESVSLVSEFFSPVSSNEAETADQNFCH